MLSNYGLYFIKPCFSKFASSPTKMAEYLALGIPIITNSDIGDSDYFINDLNCGILVNPFHQEAILPLTSGSQFDRQSLRKVSLGEFSLKDGIDKYHEIYDNLTKN